MAEPNFLGDLLGLLKSDPTEESAGGEENTSRRVRRRKRPLHLAVVLLIALLLLYIAFLVLRPGSASAAGLAVALACVAVGALLGFIFAIPKRTEVALLKSDSGAASTEAEPAVKTVPESAYRPNTSLEEISDWLTKIIVGLGLVQSQEIGRFVRDQGAAIAPELYGRAAAPILGSATLVAITVLTFLTSFLYFRLYLAEEFTRSDSDALRAQIGYELAKEKGRAQVLGPRTALKAIARSSAVAMPSAGPPEEFVAAEAQVRDIEGYSETRETLEEIIARKLARMRDNPLDPADPAKGVFGGKSRNLIPPRLIDATVRRMRNDPNNFKIDLILKSEEPKARGEVVFFYHPTFETSHERVRIAGGQAHVRLYAYGAFTVGALVDDGEVELELDLADLPGVPEEFLDN